MNETEKVLARVCAAIEDKKGEEIAVLDVREIASFTSYLVICEGSNNKQNQAICDAITRRLKKEDRLSPASVEGYREGQWILVDYLSFVVHIFSPETRRFYNLDRLWSDGKRLHPQPLPA